MDWGDVPSPEAAIKAKQAASKGKKEPSLGEGLFKVARREAAYTAAAGIAGVTKVLEIIKKAKKPAILIVNQIEHYRKEITLCYELVDIRMIGRKYAVEEQAPD